MSRATFARITLLAAFALLGGCYATPAPEDAMQGQQEPLAPPWAACLDVPPCMTAIYCDEEARRENPIGCDGVPPNGCVAWASPATQSCFPRDESAGGAAAGPGACDGHGGCL